MFERPQNLQRALELLATDDWNILSGGTDFYPALGDRPPTGNTLDISALADLQGISHTAGFWRIGAGTTWTDLIAAKLPAAFDSLKQAAREIGSIQIQNRATIAGNICNASPAADGVPPLLTLDAIIETVSNNSTRQIALADFITGNRQTERTSNELVSAILIPDESAKGYSVFNKLGSRKYLIISIAMVAVRLSCDNKRTINQAAISVGACSLVATRLAELEKALIGTNLDTDPGGLVTDIHLKSLTPIDDIRAPASYRRKAAKEIIIRTISKTAGLCR
jgi:CO/xanthine dehydrogenase FAD-binding subunit